MEPLSVFSLRGETLRPFVNIAQGRWRAPRLCDGPVARRRRRQAGNGIARRRGRALLNRGFPKPASGKMQGETAGRAGETARQEEETHRNVLVVATCPPRRWSLYFSTKKAFSTSARPR